jgi:hypothetical protein
MSKFLVTIHNNGTNYIVNDTLVVPDEFVVNPELYREVTQSLYQKIVGLLGSYIIRIPAAKVNDLGLVLKSTDLVLEKLDDLTKLKNSYLKNAKASLESRFGVIEFFEFFEFLLANNALAEKGYFITDANREEKYLEIINTGDEDLISLLENFLNVRDKLSASYEWYRRYSSFAFNLKAASTEEEAQSEMNLFLEQIF